MAFLKATLAQNVRDLLGESPWYARSKTAIASAGDLTVDVVDGTNWSVGDIIEFQDDGEQCWVESIATNELTVIRGFNGTTAAASHADEVLIVKNPIFTYNQINTQVTNAILSFWPYCWKRVADTVTPVSNQSWYDLAVDAIDLIQVYQLFGATSDKVGFFGAPNSKKSVALKRNLPAALVASTVGLRFASGLYHSTNTVYVDYRAKLTSAGTTSWTDLDAGLLADAAAYYAAARLLASKDGPRASDNDVTMGDATIEPGLRAQVASVVYEKKATELRNQYYDELMRTIPPMKVWGR